MKGLALFAKALGDRPQRASAPLVGRPSYIGEFIFARGKTSIHTETIDLENERSRYVSSTKTLGLL